METDIKVALIDKAPAVTGLILVLILVIMYSDELETYIENVTKLEIAGITFEFDKSQVPDSYSDEIKNFTPDKALKNRMAFLAPKLKKASLLVIHDIPEEAQWLAKIFRNLGMQVDVGICAEDTRLLMKHYYDVILSDIEWPRCSKGPKKATELLDELRPPDRRVVFYILNLKGGVKRIPSYAQELTNSFEEMINGVFDVVSRSDRLAF